MERLGKTFLLVIEPLDFNVEKNLFNHQEFGFMVGTESSKYLWSLFKFCRDYLNVRSKYSKQHQMNALKVEIQKNWNNILRKPLKSVEDFVRLIGIFIDLTYYTAHCHGKITHLIVFTMDLESQVFYCCYAGSNTYEHPEELSKQFFKKIKYPYSEKNDGSCFEIYQFLNKLDYDKCRIG